MSMHDDTLVVGTSASPISVTLTPNAMQLLDDLAGSAGEPVLSDHRALLTTITIGKVASGHAIGDEVVIEVADILQVIEHAGTARVSRAV